jgi:aminoglycoside 2'-N-acetyltransferase I
VPHRRGREDHGLIGQAPATCNVGGSGGPPGTTLSFSRTEELDADTRAEIIRLCVAAHQEPDFERLFSYIPSGGRHFMAYRGGELVSHAVVTTRWLHVGTEQRLRTAYVDAVATLPAYQRRGYGTGVLQLLATNLPDYDMGCLQSDTPEFYERLGWELWRGPLAVRTEEATIPTPDQRGIMVLRLDRTPALDLDGELTVESDGGRLW